MIRRFLRIVILSQLLWGCSFVVGLLRMEAVEIIAWSPNRQLVPAEQLMKRAVDHARTLATVLSPAAFVGTRERARGATAQMLWETLDDDLASFEVSEPPR